MEKVSCVFDIEYDTYTVNYYEDPDFDETSPYSEETIETEYKCIRFVNLPRKVRDVLTTSYGEEVSRYPENMEDGKEYILVHVVYSTGSTFGYVDGQSTPIAIFEKEEENLANELIKILESNNYEDSKKSVYSTESVATLSNGEKIRFYPCWNGYFERFIGAEKVVIPAKESLEKFLKSEYMLKKLKEAYKKADLPFEFVEDVKTKARKTKGRKKNT